MLEEENHGSAAWMESKEDIGGSSPHPCVVISPALTFDIFRWLSEDEREMFDIWLATVDSVKLRSGKHLGGGRTRRDLEQR